jgi:hypothetical protein
MEGHLEKGRKEGRKEIQGCKCKDEGWMEGSMEARVDDRTFRGRKDGSSRTSIDGKKEGREKGRPVTVGGRERGGGEEEKEEGKEGRRGGRRGGNLEDGRMEGRGERKEGRKEE